MGPTSNAPINVPPLAGAALDAADDDAGALVGSGALVAGTAVGATEDATDDEDDADADDAGALVGSGALVGGTGVAVGAGAHAATTRASINTTNKILANFIFLLQKWKWVLSNDNTRITNSCCASPPRTDSIVYVRVEGGLV